MTRWLISGAALLALTVTAWAGERGEASWYDRGNPVTACNVAFNPWRIAAAHRTLPCGSRAKIINLANDREIIVEIFDRGPARRTGRIIDVTVRVAEILGFKKAGVAKVLVVPLR